jgi:hypothetical protein
MVHVQDTELLAKVCWVQDMPPEKAIQPVHGELSRVVSSIPVSHTRKHEYVCCFKFSL